LKINGILLIYSFISSFQTQDAANSQVEAVNTAGSYRKAPEKHWNMEAAFRPENFRTFLDDFREFLIGKKRKLTGIDREKSKNFPTGILLPVSGDFRSFPAGSEILSRFFRSRCGRIRWSESSTWEVIDTNIF